MECSDSADACQDALGLVVEPLDVLKRLLDRTLGRRLKEVGASMEHALGNRDQALIVVIARQALSVQRTAGEALCALDLSALGAVAIVRGRPADDRLDREDVAVVLHLALSFRRGSAAKQVQPVMASSAYGGAASRAPRQSRKPPLPAGALGVATTSVEGSWPLRLPRRLGALRRVMRGRRGFRDVRPAVEQPLRSVPPLPDV